MIKVIIITDINIGKQALICLLFCISAYIWCTFVSVFLLNEEYIQLIAADIDSKAEPDFTKCNMFLGQYLCWAWNNIVINQSDLKKKFIIVVKFRLTISVWCLYISDIHL